MRPFVAWITLALATGCLGGIESGGGGGGGGSGSGSGSGSSDGPDARVVDAKALLASWSGCMTLANFQAANMTEAWSNLVSSDGKTCQNCHSEGQYNFLATDDETAYFNGLSQHSYFMLMYFSVDIPNEKVIVNTLSFKAANDKIGHPKFNYAMNAGITALNTFYMSTAGNTACGTPTMVD